MVGHAVRPVGPASDGPKRAPKLAQLRAVLLAQQAELDDLTANLRLVRETEEF